MEEEGSRMPELSEEEAAQILRNVFRICRVPENKTPFRELVERSREHAVKAQPGGTAPA